MGRPLKEIDGDSVYKLASYGCTQDEIGDYFGCSRATISERFRREFALGKANVRKNVRMWQIKRAKSGSDAMLIHLGKHYCGQHEKNVGNDSLDDAQPQDDDGHEIEP